MPWKPIPPLPESKRAIVAEHHCYVRQVLHLHIGVPDVDHLLRLHCRLCEQLELIFPMMAMPDKAELRLQKWEFLSDSIIDLILKEMEAASAIYNFHVRARTTDAYIKLHRELSMMRGRDHSSRQPNYAGKMVMRVYTDTRSGLRVIENCPSW
jgi:hypothetical protein